VERIGMGVGGVLLFLADRRFDYAGIAITATVLFLHSLRSPRAFRRKNGE